jgi:hypothetical protein
MNTIVEELVSLLNDIDDDEYMIMAHYTLWVDVSGQQSFLERSNMSNYEEPVKKVISEEGMATLKSIIFDPNNKEETILNETCPITQTKFEVGDEIKKLPCNHCFSTPEIIWWLKNEKAECPICRKMLDYDLMFDNDD